jgi:hypothetical protein
MRRFASFAVLVLLAIALVPSVQASHTMGHRYLVYGRLLDVNGMPVQNQDVLVKIVDRGSSLASIVTKTDCKGDFASWEGQPGSDPPGGGKVEQNNNAVYGRYIAFHFHDTELSGSYDVTVQVGTETKTLDFHSHDRQTSVREQLGAAFPMSCGNYDQFNQTFTVRMSALADDELSYRTEQAPRGRRMEASFGGSSINGTADFNGAFKGDFSNATVAEGSELKVDVADVGSRSVSLSAQDVKFRRHDFSFVVGDSVGGVLSDFKYVGVGLVIVAILVGLYFGANKVRDKMAERKLRESSTRRRFRREKEP